MDTTHILKSHKYGFHDRNNTSEVLLLHEVGASAMSMRCDKGLLIILLVVVVAVVVVVVVVVVVIVVVVVVVIVVVVATVTHNTYQHLAYTNVS